ncbi:hypothetical protein [Alienimonas sp. DA493]|uniref:hypothetical protein n=1 Tax=Alienimonas sp. DA493 TaxID=3373605 RepID=UPI0037540B91
MRWDPSGEGGDANPWERYNRRIVICFDKDDPKYTVHQATALARANPGPGVLDYLPVYGQADPLNPVATVRNIRPSVNATGEVWRVEVTYSNEPEDEREKERRANPHWNPLDEEPKVVTITSEEMVPWEEDEEGNPPINSASDKINPPPTKIVTRYAYQVTQNYAELPANYYPAEDESEINSGAVQLYSIDKTFGAGELRYAPGNVSDWKTHDLLDVTDAKITVRYKTATVTYHWRPKTWDQRILNAGVNQLVNGEKEGITVPADDGTPMAVGDPQFLDANGAWIPNGTAADATYKTFKPYPRVSFAGRPGVV